jgi:hypothetical protein
MKRQAERFADAEMTPLNSYKTTADIRKPFGRYDG